MTKKFLKLYAKTMGRGTSIEDARQHILDTIDRVASSIAPTYRFGYHTTEDIKQEATYIALQVLKTNKYDPTRPLDRFLFRHLKNRLANFKRDNYERLEPPCKCDCDRRSQWLDRNRARHNIACPISLHIMSDDTLKAHPDITHACLVAQEMYDYIYDNIDPGFRASFRALAIGGHAPFPAQTRSAVAALLRRNEAYAEWSHIYGEA